MRESKFLNNGSESISTKMTLKSHKLLAGVLALVLVAGLTSPAFAFTIDSFDTGSMDFLVDAGTPEDTEENTGLPLDETIGGVRNATGFFVGGESNIQAMLNPPTGIMGWSAGVNTQGNLVLLYNGTANGGLGGEDFTLGGAGDRILVNMTNADAASDFSVTLTDTNGNECGREKQTAASGAQELNFIYANFDVPANCLDDIDLTSINTFELRIDGNPDGDYAIDLIGIPQMRVGGTIGSMDTTTLLVAGAQANMGLWSLALIGAVATSAAVIYKKKSDKTEQ